MSDTIRVPQAEHGVVRVFAIDLPETEVAPFADPDGDRWPLKDALGAETLEPDRVEVVRLGDLDEIGLTAYLEEGYGIPAEELTTDAPRLSGLKGHVAVLPSSAFRGKAQTLTVSHPLRYVGAYRERGTPISFEPLPAGSARGTLSGTPAQQPPPQTPRIGLYALLAALGVLFVAVVTWLVVGGGE